MFLSYLPALVATETAANEGVLIPVWMLLIAICPLVAVLLFFLANRGNRPGKSNRILNAAGLAFIYAALAGASQTPLIAGLINGAEGAEGHFNDHIIESGGTAGMFAVSGIVTLTCLVLFLLLDQYVQWRIVLAVLFAISALVFSRTSVEMQEITHGWVYGLVQPALNGFFAYLSDFFNHRLLWV